MAIKYFYESRAARSYRFFSGLNNKYVADAEAEIDGTAAGGLPVRLLKNLLIQGVRSLVSSSDASPATNK